MSLPDWAQSARFAIFGYLLGKIEKTAVDSTVKWGFKRLFGRENKMKELYNIGNGALVLSEQGGDFKLTFSEKAALGGGLAAGIVSIQGEGTLLLKGKMGFDLGMKIIEAHSPAPLAAMEAAGAAIVDGVVAGL